MRSRMVRALAIGAFALLSGAAAVAAQTKTVIVVRHAEKVDDSADPALSEKGAERARALADALADRNVGAIFTTQFQRTRMTAAPLAERLGVTATVVAAAGGNHAADVATRVRESAAQTVLVVGHSNTVPAIIRALGAPDVGAIEDSEYDNMFVVTITPEGATVVRSRYGVPQPAGK
jgi:broad specificity phosphatase PhoE